MRALLASMLLLGAPAVAHAGLFDAAEPNVARGNDELSAGRAAAALPHYERAIEAHPDAAEAWHDKGLALHALGRHEEAAEAFTQALARRHDEALGAKDYTNLGNSLAAMDRVDDAMRSYRSALEIDPDDEVARQNLEVLLRRKQQDASRDPRQDSQDSKQDSTEDSKDSNDAGQDPQDSKDPQQGTGDSKDPQQGTGDSKDPRQGAGDSKDRDTGDQKESPQGAGDSKQDRRDPEDSQRGSGDSKDPAQGDDSSQDPSAASGDRQESGTDAPKPDGDGRSGGAQPQDTPPGDEAAGASGEGPGDRDGERRGAAAGDVEKSEAQPVRRSDTERILDSLRGNEKSFQLWRSQEKGRRTDAEKDW